MPIRVRTCVTTCVAMIAFAPTSGLTQILTQGESVLTGGATPSTPNSTSTQPHPPAKLQRVNTSPDVNTPSARPPKPPSNGQGAKVARCVGGALAGGLFAGVLVSALGGSKDLVNKAIAAGAGAGCALGYNWSPRDKQAYDDASQEVFDDPTGRQHELVTPDSKDHLTLVSTGSSFETRPVEFQHFDNVVSPPVGTRVISRPYRTTVALHLRSAPDESAIDNIVGRFDPSEIVEVVGQTPDGRWAMIGESGVIVGYAAMSRLAPMDETQTLRRTVTAKAKPDTQRTAHPKTTQASLASPRGQIQTARLIASTQCKSLVATSGDQEHKKETKGCNSPGGKWLLA